MLYVIDMNMKLEKWIDVVEEKRKSEIIIIFVNVLMEKRIPSTWQGPKSVFHEH